MTTQPQVANPDAAYRFLQEQIYLPTLRDKIAQDYPQFAPKSVEDLIKLASIADRLRPAYDAQEKQASVKSASLLDRAMAKLENSELGQQQKAAQFDHNVKAASVNASFNPQVALAILSLAVAETRPELVAAG